MKENEPEKVKLNPSKVDQLEKQIKSGQLSSETQDTLIKILKWAVWVNRVLELKNLSMKRFKRMIFGSKTEKGPKKKKKDDDGNSDVSGPSKPPKPKKKKTNGRTPGANYCSNGEVIHEHQDLNAGDQCPECDKGTLYHYAPTILVTFEGHQPVTSKKHTIKRLRCSACGGLFTPHIAEELRKKKYDESVKAALALMRYGLGMPFHRLEDFQKMMGVPLSDSIQWRLVEEAASPGYAIFCELQKFAANAKVLHNDDTKQKILEYLKENEKRGEKDRVGAFTTAMVAIKDHIKVALFFSGRNHAGENLLNLLEKREQSLDKIITMNDAAPCAMPENLDAEISNCFSHARRRFKELLDAEKATRECEHMLYWIGKIYFNEKKVKALNLSDEERLRYHQLRSQYWVKRIYKWCLKMIRERKEEPNSSLGGAISYMLNHWTELTKFMHVAGAPLDNNICEQLIKSAIRHRKNSLFYKTEYGALIGDIFMSLIQTCKNVGANPFEYLKAIQVNKKEVFKYPANWLPWTYAREANFQANVTPHT